MGRVAPGLRAAVSQDIATVESFDIGGQGCVVCAVVAVSNDLHLFFRSAILHVQCANFVIELLGIVLGLMAGRDLSLAIDVLHIDVGLDIDLALLVYVGQIAILYEIEAEMGAFGGVVPELRLMLQPLPIDLVLQARYLFVGLSALLRLLRIQLEQLLILFLELLILIYHGTLHGE